RSGSLSTAGSPRYGLRSSGNRIDSAERRRAPARRHHHGWERPLGAPAEPAAGIRSPRRDAGGAGGGGGGDLRGGRGADPLRLLPGELAAAAGGGGGADGPP